jgi:hypothetical protein
VDDDSELLVLHLELKPPVALTIGKQFQLHGATAHPLQIHAPIGISSLHLKQWRCH